MDEPNTCVVRRLYYVTKKRLVTVAILAVKSEYNRLYPNDATPNRVIGSKPVNCATQFAYVSITFSNVLGNCSIVKRNERGLYGSVKASLILLSHGGMMIHKMADLVPYDRFDIRRSLE